MQFWNPLKKIPLFHKEEKPEYFLSLILRDLRIEASVFKNLTGKVEILGRGSETLSSSIEEIEQEELLEACDKAIAGAEENLPPNISSSKTILAVKDNWVSEGRIKKEYLAALKKLKEDLELEFLGFVVIAEAVSHLLQKEDGVPITSILVGKEGQTLTVALVRAGNMAKVVVKTIGEENVGKVLESILKTFKDYEVLPSRITLFDGGENLEELRQELISFPWTKTLPFLHFPKIEVLEENFVQRAVAAGFATQMGVEFETDKTVEKEPVKKLPVEKTEIVEEETFGFVKEKDILEEEGNLPETTRETKEGKKLFLSSFKLPQFKLPTINFNFSLPNFQSNKIGVLLAPLLLLIFLTLGYVFLPRATITLFVSPKTLELDREVIIDPNIQATDFANSKIKASEVSVEVNDNLEAQATGKKEVGEKARGEVTIYNSSSQNIMLIAGTTITAQNNLKFTLDEKISIASASGDVFTGTTPSKQKVAVTAVQIGEEGNLPSGTTFSIGSLTNIAAKNENAFSGGTKKEVTVVSRQDQDNLTKTLLDKLAQKAKEDILKDKSQTQQKIVDTAFSQEILEKKFSKNITEEASKFSLSLKVKFKTLSFNQNELQSLFESQIDKDIQGDFVLKTGGINVSFGKTQIKKDKSISSRVLLQATLLPKIDQNSIKNKIKGRSINEASQILTKIPNVSDYKIKVAPIFPILPKILPLRIENIKIQIVENA